MQYKLEYSHSYVNNSGSLNSQLYLGEFERFHLRFIPFLDVDLLASFEWLSVNHAGNEKVSMIMLSIHLSVLPSSFSWFYFVHI